MGSMNWERWARATGIAFVVAIVAAFIVLGEQAKVSASNEEILSFYGDRGRVMTAAVIFLAAFVLLIWFAGAIANALRESGEGRLAATTIALAATFVGAQTVTMALLAGMSLNIAAAGDAGVVQALHTLGWSIDTVATIPLAGYIAAATMGLWRAKLVPSWFGPAGFAAAVLVLLRGTNWATDGFWSPSGGYSYVMIVAGLLWVLVTSVLLYKAAPAAAAAPTRAAATPS